MVKKLQNMPNKDLPKRELIGYLTKIYEGLSKTPIKDKLSPNEFKVPEGIKSIPEIVFNALDIKTIEETMLKSIQGILDVEGLIKISAGNYGGKLGKYKIFLRELGLKEKYFS